ncbi:MAG: phosphatase PAP2 family protein, partial [Acidobacteria bacterium]|nr:phosphatase PAP2 family protein [Acidobacteriota bacterium]
MRIPDFIHFVVFSLLTVLAWLRPTEPRRRWQATAIGLAGIGATAASQLLDRVLPRYPASIVRDWLPAALILVVYHQSGRLFRRPNAKLQELLQRIDRRLLGVGPGPVWIEGALELAYLFCYVLIPLGVGVLYLTGNRREVDVYWAIVLPPTYICYVLVPFSETLPPRSLSAKEAGSGAVRRLNLWILDRASIQVNTFPSAHVAATVAASLALLPHV